MNKALLAILLLFPVAVMRAQTAAPVNEDSLNAVRDMIRDSIEKEAAALYIVERAAWVGTDVLWPTLSKQQLPYLGYVSYINGKSAVCIFFQADAKPMVVATASFVGKITEENAKISFDRRKPTTLEIALIQLRTRVKEEIDSSIVKKYKGINLNLSYVRKKWGWHAYILSASTDFKQVIFVNDASLKFLSNKKGTELVLISKTKLHNSLLSYQAQLDSNVSTIVHSHVLDEGLFTVPELVTLRLYKDFYNWPRFSVIGKNYYSMYNKEKDYYLLLTRIAFDRIYGR